MNWTNSYNVDHGGTYILGNRMRVNLLLSFNARVYARTVDYNRVSYANPAFSQSATQPYALPNQPRPGNYSRSGCRIPAMTRRRPSAVMQAGNAYHTYIYVTHQYGVMPHFAVTLPHNLVKFGGDYSHTTLHSAEYWYGANPMPLTTGYNNAWDEHDGRSLGSAFVQDTISLFGDTVHVTPGLKYMFARTSDFDNVGFFYPNSGTISDTEHYTSPTIGVNWQPVRHWSLYAAWGETAKFPGIAAYYNNVGGNSCPDRRGAPARHAGVRARHRGGRAFDASGSRGRVERLPRELRQHLHQRHRSLDSGLHDHERRQLALRGHSNSTAGHLQNVRSATSAFSATSRRTRRTSRRASRWQAARHGGYRRARSWSPGSRSPACRRFSPTSASAGSGGPGAPTSASTTPDRNTSTNTTRASPARKPFRAMRS